MTAVATPRATARRLEVPVALTLAVLAVVAALLVRTYPNYDSYYHLVWGRDLLHGVKPGFTDYAAPTEHPLYIALCALLSLLGHHADRALVIVCVLSLVALVWAVYRVGEAVFGMWPGLAAAFFVGSSFAFLLYAVRAYVDVPFLAIVLWAAAIEARRPRAGTPVAALLALAGLLRPEAWVLAGAYWLWVGPFGRPRSARPDLLALAVAAPVVWCLVDASVTGDPLHSLHATSELADELNRSRGIGALPGAFVSFLTNTARAPVAAAGVLGIVLAWRLRAGRALHVPVALFGAGVVTFLATGVAGLSVLPRYLTVPVIAMCLFAGYGALGFTTLPRGSPLRRGWTAAAAVLAVFGIGFAGVKAPVVHRLTAELRFIRTSHDDLVAMLHAPPVRSGLGCGPLTFPTYRLVPDSRWVLDLPASRVRARSDQRFPHGVAMFFVTPKLLSRYGFAQGASATVNVPDAGYAPIARNGSYAAYASCGTGGA